MKRLWVASLALFASGGLGLWLVHSLMPSAPVSSESTPKAIDSPSPTVHLPKYQRYSLPNSDTHTVTIAPQSRFKVSIALSPTLETIDQFAKPQNAVAVLNGGFFDPKNEKTTSYITKNGKVVSDPKQNDRLTQNLDLAP